MKIIDLKAVVHYQPVRILQLDIVYNLPKGMYRFMLGKYFQ